MIMRMQEKETVQWWKVSGRLDGRLRRQAARCYFADPRCGAYPLLCTLYAVLYHDGQAGRGATVGAIGAVGEVRTEVRVV